MEIRRKSSLVIGAVMAFSALATTNCGSDPVDDGGEGGEGTGGASTGGSNSGGSNTGGSNTGGSNTGGSDTGGNGGEGGGSDPGPDPETLVLVAYGRSVSLVGVAGGELEVIDTAEIPGAGLLAGHQIFNMIQQPGENVVFVGSSNDCSSGDDWCWGNGRIDRFAFTNSTITHDGLAYEMNDAAFQADGISCAEGTEVDTGYEGQEGECAPGGLSFSTDGSRFYVDDDDLDGVEIFSVESDGDLAFEAEGGNTDTNGLACHPDGTYVYNGTNVLSIASDTVTDVDSNSGGNATEVIEGEPPLLVTTIGVTGLGVYDLTDPEAPSEIDSVSIASNQVRYQAHDADLSRFIVVGLDSVRSIGFAEDTLTIDDEVLRTEDPDYQYRSVAITGEEEEFAVVAYFTGGDGGAITNGGIELYSIDPETGELTLDDSEALAGPARSVLRVVPE